MQFFSGDCNGEGWSYLLDLIYRGRCRPSARLEGGALFSFATHFASGTYSSSVLVRLIFLFSLDISYNHGIMYVVLNGGHLLLPPPCDS